MIGEGEGRQFETGRLLDQLLGMTRAVEERDVLALEAAGEVRTRVGERLLPLRQRAGGARRQVDSRQREVDLAVDLGVERVREQQHLIDRGRRKRNRREQRVGRRHLVLQVVTEVREHLNDLRDRETAEIEQFVEVERREVAFASFQHCAHQVVCRRAVRSSVCSARAEHVIVVAVIVADDQR